MTVRLPRRLPDREPERTGEARDIARAIRCIKHWRGLNPEATYAGACVHAYGERWYIDRSATPRDETRGPDLPPFDHGPRSRAEHQAAGMREDVGASWR